MSVIDRQTDKLAHSTMRNKVKHGQLCLTTEYLPLLRMPFAILTPPTARQTSSKTCHQQHQLQFQH